MTISTGIITTFAGTGISTYSGDGGPASSAALSNPYDLVLDASGITNSITLLVAVGITTNILIQVTCIFRILVIIVSAR